MIDIYINQCAKAIKIQELWRPCSGDLYYEHIDEKPKKEWTDEDYAELLIHRILGSDDEQNLCSSNIINHIKLRAIWLPRQEDLQNMVIPEDEQDCLNKYVVLLDDFQDWVLNRCDGLEWSYLLPVSMEQLWLAFVMEEKYNKVWNGEDWV